MKLIPTHFTKKGFTHTQLARAGRIALFQRAKPRCPAHFEVVIIDHHNGFIPPCCTTMSPPAETYPSTAAWGRTEWTYTDRPAAQEKFDALRRAELESY